MRIRSVPIVPVSNLAKMGVLRDAQLLSPEELLQRYPEPKYSGEVFMPISDKIHSNIIRDRFIVSNYGRIYDLYLNKELPWRYNNKDHSKGYHTVHLVIRKDYYHTIPFDEYVHRIVLMTFNYVDGCENLEGNHINGDKDDNRLCNLEWVTSTENCIHAINIGLNNRSNNMPKITEQDAINICNLRNDGLSPVEISKITGIDSPTVRNVINGNSFKDISSVYLADAKSDMSYDLKMIHSYILDHPFFNFVQVSEKLNVPLYIVYEAYNNNYTV